MWKLEREDGKRNGEMAWWRRRRWSGAECGELVLWIVVFAAGVLEAG